MERRMQLVDWGAVLVGRQAGVAARQEFLTALDNDDVLVIDLDGVSTMSGSFADEAFGVLAAELATRVEQPSVRIENIHDDVRPVVQAVLARQRELA